MRSVFGPFCVALSLACAVAAATMPHPSSASEAMAPSPSVTGSGSAPSYSCAAPAELLHLANPLARFGRRLIGGQPLKIIAIGSSSTAGAGASSPDRSYPSQLAVELRALFPKTEIAVLNLGANGEEAREMIARFDSVIAEKPDLVLWQVGSNAVLRDLPLGPAASMIHQGIERLKQAGAEVVLIDPQFAPKVLAKIEVDDMVDLLQTTAKMENINLFRRFAVMRHWRQNAGIPYKVFLSDDELHMNDWSYRCLAKLLARSIAEASTRATVTATTVAAPR